MAKRRAKPPTPPPVETPPPAPIPDPAASDRRRYPRLGHVPLMANIAGMLVRVVNVSAKGMTVERRFPTNGSETLSFTLYPCEGRRLDLNKGVKGTGIVTHEDETLAGIRFEPATLALVKLVVSHADPPPG